MPASIPTLTQENLWLSMTNIITQAMRVLHYTNLDLDVALVS